MKFLTLIIPLLLSCLCQATKFQDVLQTIGSDGILRINDKNYKEVMENEDYSLVLFVTASDPRIGCKLCVQELPIYASMASSYYTNLASAGLSEPVTLEDEKAQFVIAYSDLGGSKKLYQALNVVSVPKIFYYAPGKAPDMDQPTDQYRFTAQEAPETFAHWVMSHSTSSKSALFKTVTKTDYKTIAQNIFIAFCIVVIVIKKFDKFAAIFSNERLWRAACMILCVLFCSGYMYNKIRGTPFTGQGAHKEVVYFAPSQQSQYAAETQIVSVIYVVLVICVIVVMDTVHKLTDSKKQFLVVSVATAVAAGAFSYLISCFKLKNALYPYTMSNIL